MPQRINTGQLSTQHINTHGLKKSAAKQKGMTFIEVLIALVIMVTGILGAVAMQATAKKGSFDAMQRSLASALAQDMLERIRSNDASPINGILTTYTGTYGAENPGVAPVPACNTPAALCNSTQMVTTDLYQWSQLLRGANVTSAGQNVGGLISAIGCVAVNNNTVTVAVSWQGRTSTKDGAAANANFTTNAACGLANNKRRQVHIQAFIF
jgi:type IV pilus assembly protein PilV